MKRRAFLQALVLVLLLGGSWALLLLRLRHEPAPADADVTPAPAREPAAPPDELDTPPDPGATDRAAPAAPDPLAGVPAGWREWIAHLDGMPSPAAMRATIGDLRQAIFDMPAQQAVERLLEFLRSGADLRTGLAFQVGPQGALRGAASLRALLLDWLHQLDPALAAEWAARELAAQGVALAADVFVIHLRNYELGAAQDAAARHAFLDAHMEALLRHEPWMTRPTSAVAEAMDVAVHTGAVQLIPLLAGLLERDRPQLLRHAGALALERLVDRAPVAALEQLLGLASTPSSVPAARAGYFARLDPALPGAGELLDRYLAAPGVTREEALAFLGAFPNLNQSLSHNLLSSQFSATDAGDHPARLRGALDKVRQWRADPALRGLHPALDAAAASLAGMLGEQP